MKKVLALALALMALLIAGCTSSGSSTKQLDESTARSMIANYITTKHYKFNINIDQLFPYLVNVKTSEDYSTGNVGPYGPLLKRLLEQNFISRTASTATYPEIVGTFYLYFGPGHGVMFTIQHNLYAPGTGGESFEWVLKSVPGTNELRGQCKFPNATVQARAAVEPDGRATLYCGDLAFSAKYIENGLTAHLKLQSPNFGPGSGPSPEYTAVGPATGKRVTVTWYAYSLSPSFKALMKSTPYGKSVVGGNVDVGEVTNLRLDTDTKATANYAFKDDLNSTGRLFYPAGGIHGEGHVVFGKKPDQTWAVDSVTATGPLPLAY